MYLVDGNNLMGQTPGWHRDKPAARRKLLGQLAAFARLNSEQISVVFDGKPDESIPDGSAYHGVRVLYATKGSDADARIKRLVESSQDRQHIVVVTSDRRLALAVRSRGASSMRSGQFRRLMEETFRAD
jgi:predicted RNA-binding protein with PIN domain